jgi:hypothetical protein
VSLPDSKLDDAPVQKQKANVYTMMLIVSFLALVVGCIFLYLEMKTYDMKIRPGVVQLAPAAGQGTIFAADRAAPQGLCA